jgi:hypothetical protein
MRELEQVSDPARTRWLGLLARNCRSYLAKMVGVVQCEIVGRFLARSIGEGFGEDWVDQDGRSFGREIRP